MKIWKPAKNETLGISRRNMPQVASQYMNELWDWLEMKGAKIRKVRFPANSLKAIQGEFDDVKIISAMYRRVEKDTPKPLIASQDRYIIDGHHRWLAVRNMNATQKLPVWHVSNFGIHKLLEEVKKFPYTTYKGLMESQK